LLVVSVQRSGDNHSNVVNITRLQMKPI